MQAELEALGRRLEAPTRPLVALVGGAKVSTKIDLLEQPARRVDVLVIGGGMANTFLQASGIGVGKSLCERDLAATARGSWPRRASKNCADLLPVDAVVAGELKAERRTTTYGIDGPVRRHDPRHRPAIGRARSTPAIDDAATLVWNGPLGAFELAPFDQGTVAAARHAAARTGPGKLSRSPAAAIRSRR